MKKTRLAANPGDVFTIELVDGSCSVGTIISIQRRPLNPVLCGFYACRLPGLPDEAGCVVDESKLVSLQFVTPEGLYSGAWKVVSSGATIERHTALVDELLKDPLGIGIPIRGARTMEKFLNAYHGLVLWNDLADPEYLDKLLLPGVCRPRSAVLNDQAQTLMSHEKLH